MGNLVRDPRDEASRSLGQCQANPSNWAATKDLCDPRGFFGETSKNIHKVQATNFDSYGLPAIVDYSVFKAGGVRKRSSTAVTAEHKELCETIWDHNLS